MRRFKKAVLIVLSAMLLGYWPGSTDLVLADAQNGYKTDAAFPDAVTYIRFSNAEEAVPVSYVRNGKQLLTGDGKTPMHIHILADTLLKDALPAEELVRWTYADTAASGKESQPDFSCMVMTDGDWELFLDSPQYQAYSMKNQPSDSKWHRYFKKLLKQQSVDSPVVIKESYTFDWGGVKTEVVTASNVLVSKGTDLKEASGKVKNKTLPSNEHPAVYTISALFRDGAAALPIFADIQPVPSGKKAFDRSGEGIAFYPPTVKGTLYQDDILSVQFDKENRVKKFRCFFNMNGEGSMRQYRCFPAYLICDLDGDGQSELVAYHHGTDSLSQLSVVYRLVDGVPKRSFSITP